MSPLNFPDSTTQRPATRGMTWLIAVLIVLSGAGIALTQSAVAQNDSPDLSGFSVTLEPVVSGLDRPLWLTAPPDDPDRLIVLLQGGAAVLVRDGDVASEPFLDLRDRAIDSGYERGLLGLAFHPKFTENGAIYVYYTDENGDSVLSRFTADNVDADVIDPATEVILLRVDQPFPNHNGGALMFGPDGYLYLGLGDGGAGGDPENNGQDPSTLLGSILRLDVDPDAPGGEALYAIPSDNPFVDADDAQPEIWAYGLRNPWRFSFDRETGDLYIADVGQNAWEEINFQPADSPGGENYGWAIREGANCYSIGTECPTDGLVDPVIEYDHSLGNSVTGGYVYRGEAAPELDGVYLFADFGTGRLWGAAPAADETWALAEPIETELNISSFGEDANGEVYLTAFDGTVYRLVGS